MSFIDGAIKPRLVEQKIVDKITKVQEENKPFKIDFDLIWTNIYKVLSKNMVPLIIIFIVIILLLYRYYDVKKKKAKLLNKEKTLPNYDNDYDNDNFEDVDTDVNIDVNSDYSE